MVKPCEIFVLGSLNADLVQTVDRLPTPGETLAGGDLEIFPGGKGANQACAAARMGGKVSMIGQVGSDGFGTVLLDSLRLAGVDTEHVGIVKQATGTATILVFPNADNSIVISPGANRTLTPDVAGLRLRGLRLGSLLLCQMEVPPETVEAALRFAQERGARTVFDPAPAHPSCIAWLDAVDFLTPNENEATRLLGREGSIQNEQQAAEAAKELRRRGAKSVVIKLGARGCFVATEETCCAVNGFVVEAVDTTAAGDTFNGAFAAALAGGAPVVEAARFANAAAALSVTRRGAQSSIPSRTQVEQFLEQAAAR